jgi:pimeloyl-ACP methyl ester carboxylesterase
MMIPTVRSGKRRDAKMDIRLNFAETGAGEVFLLLHGNGENSDYFKNQVNYFSRSYRVIAVDTRGHGNSPRGTAPFTLSQFAEDLKEFLDERGIRRVSLLGFSDGGNIALLFALKYPQYIEKMILNGANLFPGGVRAAVQIPIVIGYGIVSFFSLFWKKLIRKKEMLALMVHQPNLSPRELKNLRIPTLVIVGTNDMIQRHHSRLIAASIENSVFREIKGTHFIAAEKSAEFNDAVSAFLQS